MAQNAKTESLFQIFHKKIDGKNIVTIAPKTINNGYPPKDIELSDEQWNGLQYHFAKLVNDKEGISKLAYVY